MKKHTKLLAFGLMMSVAATAQPQWIPFTKTQPTAPTVNVTTSTNQTVSFEVEIGGMYKTDIQEGGITYHRIAITGAATENGSGVPEVPVLKYMVAVPECSSITLSYNVVSQKNFTNYTVYPVPAHVPVEDPEGAVTMVEQFTLNPAAYTVNQFYSATPSAQSSDGYFRAQKYVEVTVNPLSYNPVTKQIKANERIVVTLQFTNPTSEVNQNSGIFNAVAANTFINYLANGMNAAVNDRAATPGSVQYITLTNVQQASQIVADYLIITDDIFFNPADPNSQLTRIAQHRADYNGFDVAIVDVENVMTIFGFPGEPHWQARSIRAFVKEVFSGHNAHHTYDGKLGYVLLVGDVYEGNTGMPASFDHVYYDGYGIDKVPSDYYYSCVTTGESSTFDEVGDLFIGRFSVQNSEHLFNMVEKTIHFETEYSFDIWRNSVGFTNGNIADNMVDYFTYYYDFVEQQLTGQNLSIVNAHEVNDQIAQPTLDYLNNGVVFTQYNGHGNKQCWEADMNTNYFQTNLENNDKTPFICAVACNTGWFDGNSDCLAEVLTRFSSTKGAVGYIGSSREAWLATSYPINYSNLAVTEVHPYFIFNKKSFVAGEFNLLAKLYKSYGSWLTYRNMFNYFGDPALNIMASGFQISSDVTIPNEIWDINTDIKITNGAKLTVNNGATLNLHNRGSLTFDEGTTLLLNSATINGVSPTSFIKVKGSMSNEGDVYLQSISEEKWNGLIFDGGMQTYLLNSLHFVNTSLSGNSATLSLSNCSFSESDIKTSMAYLKVESSSFTNSNIIAAYPQSKTTFIEILNCNFNCNSNVNAAINIESYRNFKIARNTFYSSNNSIDAISISNAGWGRGLSIIEKNNISGFATGLQLYHSYAEVSGNIISQNKNGISSLNNSSVKIYGNIDAVNEQETQRIINNNKYQVYTTDNSFPSLKWNAIYGQNQQYSYIYYAGWPSGTFDVRNNYWGTNFNPSTALFPHQSYSYIPIWELKPSNPDLDVAENKYNTAVEYLANDLFSSAVIEFKEIITDFPDTKFALESLKQLMIIENSTTSNYTALNAYYLQVAAVNENGTAIAKLSSDFANYCLIVAENYIPAKAYLNNKLNSDDNAERIFAAIDLEYIDQLIENSNSNKAAQTQNYTNIGKYIDYKDGMLRQLAGGENNTQEETLQAGLGSNNMIISPNPTRLTLKIQCSTALKQSNIQLKVFDLLGTESLHEKYNAVEKGTHDFTLNTSSLCPGVYIVRLYVNDIASCTQKLLISE